MEFVISDLHFGSDNIIKYCNRPFINADHARKQMIDNWNKVVKPDDTVYVLGDFIMGQPETVPDILNQLNGHIVLVRGNHDTKRKLGIYAQYPEKVEVHDIFYKPYRGLYFVMCHFPITDEGFLDMVVQDNSEVCVLHGHVHDKEPFFNPLNHTFNVSADVVNFTPISLKDIWHRVYCHFVELGVWREKDIEGDS